ncbi:MAG: transcription antitermination factor NusB [Actinomycetota bacterium]
MSSGRHPDERSDAREQAVMLLYEAEQRGVSALVLAEDREIFAAETVKALVSGVEASIATIDAAIATSARGWAVDRMPALDRAILRLAIHELGSRTDVPVAVVIDEAVELAKKFSTDDSGRFVNGLLATLARTLRPAE